MIILVKEDISTNVEQVKEGRMIINQIVDNIKNIFFLEKTVNYDNHKLKIFYFNLDVISNYNLNLIFYLQKRDYSELTYIPSIKAILFPINPLIQVEDKKTYSSELSDVEYANCRVDINSLKSTIKETFKVKQLTSKFIHEFTHYLKNQKWKNISTPKNYVSNKNVYYNFEPERHSYFNEIVNLIIHNDGLLNAAKVMKTQDFLDYLMQIIYNESKTLFNFVVHQNRTNKKELTKKIYLLQQKIKNDY